MLTKFKTTVQLVILAALVLEAGGCIFVDRDRWHHDHPHDDHAAIDVNVH